MSTFVCRFCRRRWSTKKVLSTSHEQQVLITLACNITFRLSFYYNLTIFYFNIVKFKLIIKASKYKLYMLHRYKYNIVQKVYPTIFKSGNGFYPLFSTTAVISLMFCPPAFVPYAKVRRYDGMFQKSISIWSDCTKFKTYFKENTLCL